MPISQNGLKTTTSTKCIQVFSQVNKYTLSYRFLHGNVQGCVFAKNRPVSLNWTDYTTLYKSTSVVGTVTVTTLYKSISVVGTVTVTTLYKSISRVGTETVTIVRPANRDWACQTERCHTLSNKTSLQ